jgi:hypothetical protein
VVKAEDSLLRGHGFKSTTVETIFHAPKEIKWNVPNYLDGWVIKFSFITKG